MLKMRWQVVAQIARRSQTAIGAGLAQAGNLVDQQVDLFLLADDDLVELVKQVFCVAGFDLQLGQTVVGIFFRIHA